jgi:CheY-like chemotaxis protein/signal transduction histidine kinase/HAMP domain-containing protein
VNFKLSIRNKVLVVACIGVLGFISYFALSLKNNFEYRALFEEIGKTDLVILDKTNDINLMLSNIEGLTQNQISRANLETARQLKIQVASQYQMLQTLDPASQEKLSRLSALSEQYIDALLALANAELNQLEASQVISGSELRDLARRIVEEKEQYRAYRYQTVEKKVSQTQQMNADSLRIGFIVGLVLALVMLLVARHFAAGVTKTLSYLSIIASKIALGDWHVEIVRDTNDETADVLIAMEQMRSALQARAIHDQQRDEEQTRMASLVDLTRGDLGTVDLCQKIIRHMAPLLNAQVGAFYILEENSLKLISTFAYINRKDLSNSFKIGEGIIGQVALEKNQVMLSDVPDNYLSISTSLGESAPGYVVITPILYNQILYGILELGFIAEPRQQDLDFLIKAGESIAQSIGSAQARENINKMLVKTREQAEKLAQQQEIMQNANEDLEMQAMALTESEGKLLAQQEELRVSNEELEQQAVALKASEERLQAQQEELRVTNEELEEYARALEKQKKEMEQKNFELEKSRQALQDKSEALELSSKYKSEFMSTMSHELRTPLNSILILSDNLAENPAKTLTDKQVEHARVIHKAGTDLLELINDILDLAKVEEGKLERYVEEISFDKWKNDIEQLFTPVSEKKGLKFHVSVEQSLGDKFFSDEKRLNQIIKNLLGNALKFTEKGEVRLTVAPVNGNESFTFIKAPKESLLAFSVTDTGLGIKAENQQMIFEAFQQSDGAISRQYGGTGLGLTISTKLARLLEGEIKVFSEGEGKGSCFTLFIPKEISDQVLNDDTSVEPVLPVEKIEIAAPLLKKPEPVVDHAQMGSLLIVEDDPAFAAALSDLAKDFGLKVSVAHDGETGFQYACNYHPSGIILDVELPGLSGWDVMKKLQEDPRTKDIPVHFMSGHDGKEKALALGGIDFLKKPASKKQIHEVFLNLSREINKELKKLLLIEGKSNDFEVIKKLFSEKDVSVSTVSDSESCLLLLNKEQFDCIILDLDALDSDAYTFVKTLHEQEVSGGAPLIIYTGMALDRDQEAKLRKYADRIILKSGQYAERLISEASLFLHWLESKSDIKISEPVDHRDGFFENKTVLIVDDDMRNVYSLTAELEKRGIIVEAASSGQECLDLLKEKSAAFDMVLMDIMMPELDGFKTIEKIKKNKKFKDIPIIVLTALTLKEDRNRCIELGANDYLLKPIDMNKLLSLMRVWMA